MSSFSSISHSESKPRKKVSVGYYSPPYDSLLKWGNRLIVVFKSDSGNILIDISNVQDFWSVRYVLYKAGCILYSENAYYILRPALRIGIVACEQYYRAPAGLPGWNTELNIRVTDLNKDGGK